jgi:hypothetical protein
VSAQTAITSYTGTLPQNGQQIFLLCSEVPLYENMGKEDGYVAKLSGTLASYDVNLKFYLVQLFQNVQEINFSRRS